MQWRDRTSSARGRIARIAALDNVEFYSHSNLLLLIKKRRIRETISFPNALPDVGLSIARFDFKGRAFAISSMMVMVCLIKAIMPR
jgi:hypothetical protein